MMDSDYEEWLADFGRGLGSKDLDRLLARARDSSDEDLRLLVKQHQMLRWLVREFFLRRFEDPAGPLAPAERTLVDFVRSIVQDAKGGSAA